jgi:di/tricarboxylate transporter
MSLAAWLTLAVLLLQLVVRDRMAPSASMALGVLGLLAAGVLTDRDLLATIANPAPLTVAALYVVARGVVRSGVLRRGVEILLGEGRIWRATLARLLIPSAAVSAFINNTPIVAALAPALTEWADERRDSPSKYLLPMTFAVSLGGTLTLLGTSTNFVASGLMQSAGLHGIGLLEMLPVSALVVVAGLAVLVLGTPWALPIRRPAREHLRENVRHFMVAMEVVTGGRLDGVTVQGAGLRRLEGVFLVEVDRVGERIAPVAPTTLLRGGDVLTFVGKADQVVDLHHVEGLVSVEDSQIRRFDPNTHVFFEAVVGPVSPLVGRTLKELGFRGRYQAAVFAIHRGGERIGGKLGETRLRAEDTLLFIADPGFRRNDFLIVSRIGRHQPTPAPKYAPWMLVALVATAAAAAFGRLSVLDAALIAATIVVLFGVVPLREVRDAVDLDVILLVTGSIALGVAVEKSGLAGSAASLVARASAAYGAHAAVFGVTALTMLAAQILTCNAAAAIGVPLAIQVAAQTGGDARHVAIAATIAASCSFMTPLGYQTKLMVYGPGGYRFRDYLRLGGPLAAVCLAAIVAFTPT